MTALVIFGDLSLHEVIKGLDDNIRISKDFGGQIVHTSKMELSEDKRQVVYN